MQPSLRSRKPTGRTFDANRRRRLQATRSMGIRRGGNGTPPRWTCYEPPNALSFKPRYAETATISSLSFSTTRTPARALIPLGKAIARRSHATDLQTSHLAEALEREAVYRSYTPPSCHRRRRQPEIGPSQGAARQGRGDENWTSHRQFNLLGAVVTVDDPAVLGSFATAASAAPRPCGIAGWLQPAPCSGGPSAEARPTATHSSAALSTPLAKSRHGRTVVVRRKRSADRAARCQRYALCYRQAWVAVAAGDGCRSCVHTRVAAPPKLRSCALAISVLHARLPASQPKQRRQDRSGRGGAPDHLMEMGFLQFVKRVTAAMGPRAPLSCRVPQAPSHNSALQGPAVRPRRPLWREQHGTTACGLWLGAC
jgi:hypothetical protein